MPNPEEIVRLVEEMFACKAIGLYPVRRSQLPDWHKCPCCGAYADASQHAFGMEHIERAQHEPECKAMKLLEAVRSWRKEQSAGAAARARDAGAKSGCCSCERGQDDDWPPYELVGC